MDPKTLTNTYYALRHGQSLANIKDLIVSDPANGITNWGLSELGKKQAASAFAACPDQNFHLGPDTLIVSSDFLRTKQTAQIAAQALGCTTEIQFSPLLRERFFGKWELTQGNYDAKIWDWDTKNRVEPGSGVEPVGQVLDRGLRLLAEIETRHENQNILLVSHGDTLQILMTFFQGFPPHCHRELDHLETAEVRKL
jgi:probable phosphoglycerate mutase